MPKPISLALLVIGIVMLVLAAFSADSVSSGLSKLFQGTPDARTLILLILGLLALIVGGVGTLRSSPPH